jgi:alcohol dehydrogenase
MKLIRRGVTRLDCEMETKRAHVFRGVGRTGIEHVPIPKPGPHEALVHVTLTTICGTDLHIVRGEYPVKPGS